MESQPLHVEKRPSQRMKTRDGNLTSRVCALDEKLGFKVSVPHFAEHEMAKKQTKKDYTVRLPLIRSKRPGTLNLTNAEIEDLLT